MYCHRKVALNIADYEWDFINSQKLPTSGTSLDFSTYIAEKIEISLNAADVKNRGGFIVEAIRENYIDPAVQKERELRAEKAEEKELESVSAENLTSAKTNSQSGSRNSSRG